MRRRSAGAWVSFGGVILGLGLMGATVTLPSARTIPNGMAGTRLSTKNTLSASEDAQNDDRRKPGLARPPARGRAPCSWIGLVD